MIQSDFHIFQRGWNHQPGNFGSCFWCSPYLNVLLKKQAAPVHSSEMYPLVLYHVVLGCPKWLILWYDICKLPTCEPIGGHSLFHSRWILSPRARHSHDPRGCWPTRLFGRCANRSFEVQMRCMWVFQSVTKMGGDTMSPIQELQYSSHIMLVKQSWTNEPPLLCLFVLVASICLNWGWMVYYCLTNIGVV
jgi:hypothetical protein